MGTRLAPNAPPGLERKNLHTFVKVLDATQGIVEMYVAGTNNRDDGGDKFLPGAFTKTIADRKPKGIHGHDWLLSTAKTLEIEEVNPGDARLPQKMKDANAGGVRIKAQYNLETQIGRETFSNVRFYGEEQEWSVGYIAEDIASDSAPGERDIKQASLWEFSDVLWGMNPVTSTVSVKAAAGGGEAVEITTERKWYEPPEGSFEALEDDIRDAVNAAEGSDWWCSIVATFPTNVVYYRYPNTANMAVSDEEGAWRRTWATAQDGTITVGAAEAVDVVQTIVPAGKAAPQIASKVSESSWDGSASRFTDAEWKTACAACEGKSDAPKTDCYLPHHEPGGAVSRAGVHAAAARFNQTTRDNKDKAKTHLAGHYKNDLSEDVPEVLGGAAKSAIHAEDCGCGAEEKAADTSHGPHAYVAGKDSTLCATCGGQQRHWMHDTSKQLADAEAAVKALEMIEPAAHLLGTKEGRVLAKRNEDWIRAAHDSLGTVLSELDTQATDTTTTAGKGATETETEQKAHTITPADLLEFQRLAAGMAPETEEANA